MSTFQVTKLESASHRLEAEGTRAYRFARKSRSVVLHDAGHRLAGDAGSNRHPSPSRATKSTMLHGVFHERLQQQAWEQDAFALVGDVPSKGQSATVPGFENFRIAVQPSDLRLERLH